MIDNLRNLQDNVLLRALIRGLLSATKSPDSALQIAENVFDGKATQLTTAATAAATNLARSRSGNPRTRAGGPPSASGLKNASKPGTRAGNLLEKADRMASWGKLLKFAGPVTAIGLGGYAIYQGDSPSSVTLNVAAGLVGGAIIGVVAVAALPAEVAFLAGVAALMGGVLIAGSATWAYEEFLPQHVREKIDEGMSDIWHASTGALSEVWTESFTRGRQTLDDIASQ